MNRKKSLVGIGLIAALMALTGWLLFRDQPVTRLLHTLGQLRPGWLLLGLALMLAFVGCEATCSHLILGRLGHRAPLRRCLGYSFVGFYVSSITPSATGGQPAQIYYMSRDGVPAAHGALNMMLIAVCYQVVVIGYALAVALLRFDLVANLGGGLGLLLLFGAVVNGALTAGMLCLMFLPNAARRLTGGVLSLLVRVRLVRRPEEAREKLEKQMEEYRRQAELRGTPEHKAKNWMGSMLFHLSHANDVDQAWASSRTKEELDQVVEPFVQAKRQTGQWTQEDEAGYQLYRQETAPEKRTFRVWYLIANPRGLPKEFVQKELEFRWKLFLEKKEETK